MKKQTTAKVKRQDIADRSDIELLVNSFYRKVEADATIGPYFEHLRLKGWQHHLNIMYAFWENAVFYTGSYNGHPLDTHRKLHQTTPLTQKTFEVWLQLFQESVSELFNGPNAELAKQRAKSISTVMFLKVCQAS